MKYMFPPDNLEFNTVPNPSISPLRPIPLSAVQREIYIGQQLDPESPLYNMGMVFEIEGVLNTERFTQVWNQTVERSDALRIRLSTFNGEALQAAANIPIPLVNLDFSDQGNSYQQARDWIQTDLEKSIGLHGDLVKSYLIKISTERWIWFCKQHHIITDATSFAAIWHQIVSLYNCEQTKSKTEIQSSFLDYVRTNSHFQLKEVASDTANGIEDNASGVYWQSKSVPPSPSLYGRKPSYTSTKASRDSRFFDGDRSELLESLIQQQDIRSISPHLARFQVLLTVLFAYVYRVSGQSSITIATTAPNRSDAKYANTPGLFVELLPLTVEISSGESFASLLAKVKQEVMGFLKHAAPGAGACVPGRDISVVLNYVPLAMDSLDGTSVKTEWLHADHMDRHHALRLHAMDWNDSGQISLAFDTNDSCFSKNQKEQAQQHWLVLFDEFVNNRAQQIDVIDITVNESTEYSEVDELLSSNNTIEENNRDISLVERFEATAEKFSSSTAIVDGSSVTTYKTLMDRVNKMAFLLSGRGIGANDNVVVLLPRCLSVPISLLGILKAGATYVPVESNNPVERVRYLLEHTDAALVVTNSELADLHSISNPVLILNEDGIAADEVEIGGVGEEEVFEPADTNGSSPAYILFTSGSTGNPKGVVISRSAMLNYCDWAVEYYTQGRPLAFAFFTSLGFDLTITSLFVPLLSGGSVHVYRSSHATADDSLYRLVDDNQVDVVKLTPTHLSMLQQHSLHDSKISHLIVGGEDLKCSLAQNIHQAFNSKVRIFNEYGPTEATVGCIVHRFDNTNDVVGSVPIGRPVAGMKTKVLNKALQVQPVGVTGMLYLSGPSLADGYWRDEKQSKSLFAPVIQNGDTYYCTGDLVSIDESGRYVYRGRQDDQVKIRGARIELAEIEATVLHQTEAAACVVTAVSSDKNNKNNSEVFCAQCGLSSLYPEVTFDSHNICSLCTGFEKYKDKAQMYFKSMDELEKLVDNIRGKSHAQYDCMMLLSGGKDSTYALAQLVDMGLSVLAYTLDNGYLSTEAKANIKQVCRALNVDHEFAETPAMRKIFADSLEKYSNVCHGCFKTIYTLSMRRAQELKIPAIFTGLSRGQFFETRLTEELFSNPLISIKSIDETVLSARKAYHRTNDTFSKLIDTRHFQDDAIFDEVEVHDFYRYSDVDLDELLSYLQEKLPWIRPKDTGRSTNCLINDIGIHVHKKERGFHNYALPYSWDVRLGHKKRDAALDELDDDIDAGYVDKILSEVGYVSRNEEPGGEDKLALYFAAEKPIDPEILKNQIRSALPPWMVPEWVVQLDSLPLNDNGKVNKSELPIPNSASSEYREIELQEFVKPVTGTEKILAGIWREQLKIDRIGLHDNFFALGGDSLSAIRIAAQINDTGLIFGSAELFKYQTIAEIAQRCLENERAATNQEQDNLTIEPVAFESLSTVQLDKLSKILNKSNSAKAHGEFSE